MAGIDLGDAWADNVWESGVWADGVWAGQEAAGGGTPPPGGDPGVPGQSHNRSRAPRAWMCLIPFLLLLGCTETTYVGTDYCLRWVWETQTPPDTTYTINDAPVTRDEFERLCTVED